MATSFLRTSGDVDTLAEYDPLTGFEPNHITDATEPYIQESLVENGTPNDVEHDDVTIGKAPSSPLFTQEETKVCRPVCRRPSVMLEVGDML